ncbi:MAG: RDD family protein [Methanomassiliicoccales archaeon]
MPTGYALLESSRALRKHWLRRLAASVIDAAIIFIPIRIGLVMFPSVQQDLIAGVLAGAIWFLYSGIAEGVYGKTVGKRLLHIKVVSMTRKNLYLRQALIRSVPKLFWYAFLPLDVLLGLAMDNDPRQRFVDRVSATSVIIYEPELARIKKRSSGAKKKGPKDLVQPARMPENE